MAGTLERVQRTPGVVGPDRSELAETLKRLRSQLLQRLQIDGHSLLAVTSPRAIAGKSLAALNLALAVAAELDRTVLLADADFSGLGRHLSQGVAMDELLVNPGVLDADICAEGGFGCPPTPQFAGAPWPAVAWCLLETEGRAMAGIKLWAELQDSTNSNTRSKLKWGEIVLKRGAVELGPSSLLTLRAGQGLTLAVPKVGTSGDMLADLNNAVIKQRPLDLSVAEAKPGAALSRCSKVEALSIKQKVSEDGAVIEIELRKL